MASEHGADTLGEFPAGAPAGATLADVIGTPTFWGAMATTPTSAVIGFGIALVIESARAPSPRPPDESGTAGNWKAIEAPGGALMFTMQVSARVDYGMRALAELASRGPDGLVTGEELAELQGLPVKFLEGIMTQLRRAGLVVSKRGAEGGFRLGRPSEAITVADVFRALEGPIASVRGMAPEDLAYAGAATHLREVWVATRAALRSVLEEVTLADIVSGGLPDHTRGLLDLPGAWERR